MEGGERREGRARALAHGRGVPGHPIMAIRATTIHLRAATEHGFM